MDNNMNTGAPYNGAAAPQPQGDQQKKDIAGAKLDPKMIAIAAVVVVLLLIIFIPKIAKAVEMGKVKKAYKVYVKVLETGETDPEDVKWRKYYPKDFEDDVQDWAIDRYDRKDRNDSFNEKYEYKVLAITKLSGKDNMEMFEDQIEAFFTEKGGRVRNKDLKISSVYMMYIRDDTERTPSLRMVFVAKVNGKYGVYGY